jgi:rhodanese-related sulfurtransferase
MLMRVMKMAALVAAGALCGLGWNTVSGRGFDLGRSVFTQAGDEVIPVAEAKARHDGGALFLDARPRDFWRMNRIPGALPLPEDDFDRAFRELEARLRRTSNIVVYCSGYGCDASHVVARKLRERGFPAVVLDEGLPAWEQAGFAVDETPRS